jgi:hypothetical protein
MPVEQVIHAIHASGRQLVLEFTGAGSLALAWLHSVAGSSRTILEATDRYAPASLAELLGAVPEKNVDPSTAAAMAQRAYLRACRLGDDGKPRLGVACTATIATDRLKRGDHRCCVAVQDNASVRTFDLLISKGARDRAGEENLVGQLLIGAIAEAAGVREPVPLDLTGLEQVIGNSHLRIDPLESLWAGSVPWVVIEPDGQRLARQPVNGVVYSGSFNPLHFGHEALAGAASAATGLPVTFELAAVNAEKLAMDRAELERRLGQFMQTNRLVVTRTPLFADKARLFPSCTFLVGYDTAARLIDPRFYGGSETERDAALAAMLAADCRVLVAGRVMDHVFKTLDDLVLPPAAARLFIKLADFRADVSATALREERKG